MKLRLVNMGVPPPSSSPGIMEIKSPEPKVVYPTLYLNSAEIDGLDGLEGGEKVMLTFLANVKERTDSEQEDGKKRYTATFELLEGSIYPPDTQVKVAGVPKTTQDAFLQIAREGNIA